eukprot:Gb_15764 [translate_table: standard]
MGNSYAKPNLRYILLELLLEPNLPVASLLNGEEEVLLRGVLYEATTLVNYAFLKQSREYNTNETKPAGDKINLLFLNRLVVAHRAVQLFRSLGERSWAISFSKAFTNVHVPLELTRWLSSQKNQLKHTEALIQSRQALIGWLVNLEDQQRLKQILNKHPVFDRKKLPSEKVLNGGPNAEAVDISSNQKIEKGIEPDLFYVDMKGEGGAGKKDEELESVGKSFVVAAQNMKRIRNDGKRESNQKRKIHFQRHMLLQHEGSANKTLPEFGSDLSTSDESDLEFAGSAFFTPWMNRSSTRYSMIGKWQATDAVREAESLSTDRVIQLIMLELTRGMEVLLSKFFFCFPHDLTKYRAMNICLDRLHIVLHVACELCRQLFNI